MEQVLVTGATRGLGLAFARAYAARGRHVFAAYRDPAGASALQALADDHPGCITPIQLDVTDRESIEAATARVAATDPGRLDILINNAGSSPRGERFHNLDAESMLSVFAVNTVAPMIVARHCQDLLAHSDHPRIINLSSSMGSLAQKDSGRHYSYASSKAALNMMTRAAAHDLADAGIIVVSLHPGWVQTDLGGAHADLTPDEAVAAMLGVIDGLRVSDSGRFLTRGGEDHPW